jgi:hypothetical protein
MIAGAYSVLILGFLWQYLYLYKYHPDELERMFEPGPDDDED